MTNVYELGCRRHGSFKTETGKRLHLIEVRLGFKNLFGPLGVEHDVTLHHTAGPDDRSLAEAIRLCQTYHKFHASKGWGGIGYHFCLPSTVPYILLLRPVTLKGAHVGGWNTGNVGVMCHGTTGNRPTSHQVDAFRFLLKHSHTLRFPRPWRTDRPLNKPHTRRRGHNDWPGHTWNACPGTHKPLLDFKTR